MSHRPMCRRPPPRSTCGMRGTHAARSLETSTCDCGRTSRGEHPEGIETMNKLVAFGILAAVVLAVGIGALLYRASTGSAHVQVSISSYSFNPNNVTVKAGTTVRGTNFDAA